MVSTCCLARKEAEFIEKVVRDPYTLYWGHALAGQDGKTIREDQAWEIINSYKHIDLTMKPSRNIPCGDAKELTGKWGYSSNPLCLYH